MTFKHEIRVNGVPKPGGSKKGFGFVKGTKANGSLALGVNMADASGKPGDAWRAACRTAAILAYRGDPLDMPLWVKFEFYMPRPAHHYRGGVLKPDAPRYHSIAPDCTKLIRSIEDALTGAVWRDDSRIVIQDGVKLYSEHPGACVIVQPAV